jgi:hypothetical protein
MTRQHDRPRRVRHELAGQQTAVLMDGLELRRDTNDLTAFVAQPRDQCEPAVDRRLRQQLHP